VEYVNKVKEEDQCLIQKKVEGGMRDYIMADGTDDVDWVVADIVMPRMDAESSVLKSNCGIPPQ
jgi:hypothetical protein